MTVASCSWNLILSINISVTAARRNDFDYFYEFELLSKQLLYTLFFCYLIDAEENENVINWIYGTRSWREHFYNQLIMFKSMENFIFIGFITVRFNEDDLYKIQLWFCCCFFCIVGNIHTAQMRILQPFFFHLFTANCIIKRHAQHPSNFTYRHKTITTANTKKMNFSQKCHSH